MNAMFRLMLLCALVVQSVFPAHLVVMPKLLQWIVGSGKTVLASGFFNGDYRVFSDLEKSEKYLIQLYERLNKTFRTPSPHSSIQTKNYHFSGNTPSIGGISTWAQPYRQVLVHPELYGPWWVAASVRSDGMIDCALQIWKYACYRNATQYFDPVQLGSQSFNYDHPYVKAFVEAENKKRLNEIRVLIQKWPATLKKTLQSCATAADWQKLLDNKFFDKNFYERVFGVCALYRMMQKKIAPLTVINALRSGNCVGLATQKLYTDFCHNVAVLVDQRTQKILNVGDCTKVDLELLRPTQEGPSVFILNNPMPEDPRIDVHSTPIHKLDPNAGRIIEPIPDDDLKNPKPLVTPIPEQEGCQSYITVPTKVDVEDVVMKNEGSGTKLEDLPGVKKIMKSAEPKEGARLPTRQFSKKGHFKEALDDFGFLNPTDVEVKSNGVVTGKLAFDVNITVRAHSSGDCDPTLEIRNIITGECIKIRYELRTDW